MTTMSEQTERKQKGGERGEREPKLRLRKQVVRDLDVKAGGRDVKGGNVRYTTSVQNPSGG